MTRADAATMDPAADAARVGLTLAQYSIYCTMFYTSARYGSGTTIRRLGDRFGIGSNNGVVCHLNALRKKGWIEIPRVTKTGWRLLRHPDGRPFHRFAVPNRAERRLVLSEPSGRFMPRAIMEAWRRSASASHEVGRETARRWWIYAWLYYRASVSGVMPTVRDTMVHFGLSSPNGIMVHLLPLVRSGWLVPCELAGLPRYGRRFGRHPDGSAFDGFPVHDRGAMETWIDECAPIVASGWSRKRPVPWFTRHDEARRFDLDPR